MRFLFATTTLALAAARSVTALTCETVKTNTVGHGDRYLGTAPTNDAVRVLFLVKRKDGREGGSTGAPDPSIDGEKVGTWEAACGLF